jgi:hypothetical protein
MFRTMDEDAVIAARIRGLSVERIARSRKRGVTPAMIHDVIDRVADRVLTPDALRHALAIAACTGCAHVCVVSRLADRGALSQALGGVPRF